MWSYNQVANQFVSEVNAYDEHATRETRYEVKDAFNPDAINKCEFSVESPRFYQDSSLSKNMIVFSKPFQPFQSEKDLDLTEELLFNDLTD